MKQRYREKCDICGNWGDEYSSMGMKIVCDECRAKIEAEHGERIPLDEPLQTGLFDDAFGISIEEINNSIKQRGRRKR